ncbi:MAG TPA: EVE domain-containing protein [Planctomycetota bacterium]|nr:EVE domain-containing protein [Planctomycetota bacterium]
MPWLVKSDPETFSIDDLAKAKNKTTSWDGVRNYQARNYLRAMKKGERVLFYHSNAEPPGVVGVVKVAREAYPEPKDDEWSAVDLELVEKFAHTVSIDALRGQKSLADLMILRKGSRLSVTPITDAEMKRVLELARGKSGA